MSSMEEAFGSGFSRIWHADVIGADTWNQTDLLWWTPVLLGVDLGV